MDKNEIIHLIIRRNGENEDGINLSRETGINGTFGEILAAFPDALTDILNKMAEVNLKCTKTLQKQLVRELKSWKPKGGQGE